MDIGDSSQTMDDLQVIIDVLNVINGLSLVSKSKLV